MLEYADYMFDSPVYIDCEKEDSYRVYNFEDGEGRPFSIYTYKYQSGFFNPGDMSVFYEKALNDTYESDIFEYEEENIINILESYGFEYEIIHNETDNWNNYQLYIIVGDEYSENPAFLSEKLAPMLSEIDATLNYNYNPIGTPSDDNFTLCELQCIISKGNIEDDKENITRIGFSKDDNSRSDSQEFTELLSNNFEVYYNSNYNN